MSETIDQAVCKVDDLQVNEKKVIRIDNVGIVIYRQNETTFVAFGNKCSHFGAPLINGVIYDDKYVICPWHGACFNIFSGDIEEFPGCDNIPTFSTYIKDDEVYLKADKSQLVPAVRRPLPASLLEQIDGGGELATTPDDRPAMVVIGGGPAGFQCAVTLREEGYHGRLVLVTSEPSPPYDRTKLSKNLASNLANILLRNEEYYQRAKIELMLKTTCEKLDTETQLACLDNGNNLRYEKIFVATGSRPRKYPDPALDLATNVYYLRTIEDANQIHHEVEGKDVVLIGSSFIVIEIACSAHKTAKSISIISRTEVPFAKSLGQKIGHAVKQLLLSKSIQFYVTGNEKLEFIVESDRLNQIKCAGLFELPVDVCVVGIGSVPNSEFLHDSNMKLVQNGFIEVNERFETTAPNVFAGGDVVIYPNPVYNNRMMNIAHWQTAQAHGRLAARYMLSKPCSDFKNVPFFWSAVFGKGIRFAGTVDDPDNCLIDGDLEELAFVAYYFDSDDQVIGVATMGKDPLASAYSALLRDNQRLTKQDIQEMGETWIQNRFH